MTQEFIYYVDTSLTMFIKQDHLINENHELKYISLGF